MSDTAKAPLRRSRTDRMIGGVMGGLGRHYDVDPVKLRIIYALVTIFSAFAGVIIYLILWFLIPLEDA